MDVQDLFKEELDEAFQEALFFNKLESELAIFEALIQEVDYFLNLYEEDDLTPEEKAIRKEDLRMVFDQYSEYKEVVKPLLEEYMIRISKTDRPIHFGYYKVLKGLREERI